ncbi:hypothetical protein [Neobacillus cucumis]|uniref:hypothetical protein n=1 Tax=Neobacillus cucumis TaxID=1740721 RepID=UPI001965EE45|nr:hypothetical protein [Neobacillus cucumis]MBM7651278.1 hypothetical protein [Neobacillus cucumis]
MKIRIIMGSLLLAMAVVSGCANMSSTKAEESHQDKNAAVEKNLIKNKAEENTVNDLQEVQLDHLKIKVSSKWDVYKGLDSAAFSVNGKPVGIIEGLPYAESVETVLPNQTIVIDKQKIEDLGFDAYLVTTSTDAVQSSAKKEIHVYIFVEPKKEVYDMHFNAESVDEKMILEIVHSAEMINSTNK